MKQFENNVQYIKYLVNKELSKRFLEGTLDDPDAMEEISEAIIPGPDPITRCCIYKERAIIKERAGYALNHSDDEKIINVLDIACDNCPIDRFTVTESCRGCLAHKCMENCPKNAIMILGQRAYIDQNKCIECGRCKDACPFNAISDVLRPCVRACQIGALSSDPETKKTVIDHDKCVSCGACVYNCPFGAIIDKPYVVEVLDLLKQSNHNKDFKVYAVVAPAISSQFHQAKIGQVITGITQIGFYHVLEAALGADIVAHHEAHEFAETIDERKWMTTSCCPAFVDYMKKNFPEQMDHVSGTVSPMIAIGRLIKDMDPDGKVVFIGPCTAKKMEINQEDLKGTIDYVLTFEELIAIMDAMDINIEECEESVLDNASYFGRIFARSGGVSDAVTQVIKEEGLELTYEPVKCDGLAECVKTLKVAKAGRLSGNFIEGMACKYGCIGGAASLSHGPKDVTAVDKYGKLSREQTVKDSLRVLDYEHINLEREYPELAKQ